MEEMIENCQSYIRSVCNVTKWIVIDSWAKIKDYKTLESYEAKLLDMIIDNTLKCDCNIADICFKEHQNLSELRTLSKL